VASSAEMTFWRPEVETELAKIGRSSVLLAGGTGPPGPMWYSGQAGLFRQSFDVHAMCEGAQALHLVVASARADRTAKPSMRCQR